MKENSEKVEKAKKKSSKFIAPNSRDLPYISQFQHEDWHLGKRALLISPEAILSKHDHAIHEAILSLHRHRGHFSTWHISQQSSDFSTVNLTRGCFGVGVIKRFLGDVQYEGVRAEPFVCTGRTVVADEAYGTS
jgi:hypothetical protein